MPDPNPLVGRRLQDDEGSEVEGAVRLLRALPGAGALERKSSHVVSEVDRPEGRFSSETKPDEEDDGGSG